MIKRLIQIGVVCLLFAASVLGFVNPQPAIAGNVSLTTPMLLAAEQGIRNTAEDKLGQIKGKIDLNNTNVRAFRELPGMYPTLAGKIVKNAPFESVEDLLKLPGLSETQKATLKANFGNFVVTDPTSSLVEGADRYNNGIYD